MGPFDQDNDFSDLNLTGVTRYLDRVWRMVTSAEPVAGAGVDMRPMHRFIKRVTEELEKYQYHTAIAALMEFGNWIGANRAAFTAGAARRGRADVWCCCWRPSRPSWPRSCGSGWAAATASISRHGPPTTPR